jgi:hypothetical protein
MDSGSHVGFQISTKNTNLVEDHPMNILASLVEICSAVSEFEDSCSDNALEHYYLK